MKTEFRNVSRPVQGENPMHRETFVVSRTQITPTAGTLIYEAWEVCNGRLFEFTCTRWVQEQGMNDWLGRIGTRVGREDSREVGFDFAYGLIVDAFPESHDGQRVAGSVICHD